MISEEWKYTFRKSERTATRWSTWNRGVLRGGLIRALVLMLWLVVVPGLRPVYHHHRDDGTSGGSSAEQVRLSDHLRQYVHQDSTDTAKLHFHWTVQLDGSLAAEFPNAPPVIDVSHATWLLESGGLSAGERLFLDFAIQATVVWLTLPCPEVISGLLTRVARIEDSRGSEQARRLSYCSTLYRTARL